VLEIELLEETVLEETVLDSVELLEDMAAGLYLYRLNPLGPPQYSNLSAEQTMLHLPSLVGTEAELTVLEQ
jgi:hypothetical protein